MEENNKMCSEEVEAKKNDCKLSDEDMKEVSGGNEFDFRIPKPKDPPV